MKESEANFRAGFNACVEAVHRGLNVSYPNSVAEKRREAVEARRVSQQAKGKDF